MLCFGRFYNQFRLLFLLDQGQIRLKQGLTDQDLGAVRDHNLMCPTGRDLAVRLHRDQVVPPQPRKGHKVRCQMDQGNSIFFF